MSTTYYKATRPDGGAFANPAVVYEVGKRVRPVPARNPRICAAGYLHAADVPAETLIGGIWPCRLFEVTGRPVVGFDAKHPHKGGFRQLQVVREIPAHLALGPNGEAVAALIERAGKLTSAEVVKLYAARDAARNAARDAARNAARNAARDAAWYAAVNAADALVSKDLISAEHFEILYGPWAAVIDNTTETK
jgi:hypothetical protein